MKCRRIYSCLFGTVVAFLTAAGSDWPEVTSTSKPWTRWWWHGSAVEESELTCELESISRAGFGGVEITPIFGVQGMDHLEKEYLSPEWLSLLEHACLEAQRLGMGVDVIPGTGWRMGSMAVPEGERAVRLKLQVEKKNGERSLGFSVELSGEKVKRAAPGGGGFTVDVLNQTAVHNHMKRTIDPLFEHMPASLVRAVFHDSWEYNTDWTHAFEDEFRKRRDYDVREILPVFEKENDQQHSKDLELWRYDYRLTLEELLLENFASTFNESAHGHGLLSRNQAHGSIANLLDVYAMADIPETEIFRDHETYLVHKMASSAAHVAGRQLVSSESFTWLSEHWTTDLAKLKRFTDYLFLCGTNHIYYHGTAYSPADAQWPGWLFYASSEINDRNPLWHHLPALNAYIARCQSLLQSGKPYAEAYLYWPIADLYCDAPGTRIRLHISGEDWFHGSRFEQAARQLWEKGMHFDYVSDRQIQEMAGSNRKLPAIILPPFKYLPLETAEALVQLAQRGIEIFSLGEDLNGKIPGIRKPQQQARLDQLLVLIREQRLIRQIDAGDLARLSSDPWQSDGGLRCIRRILDDGSDLLFIVNRSGKRLSGIIPVSLEASSWEALDPWTGAIETLNMGTMGQLSIELEPEASVFVRVGGTSLNSPNLNRQPSRETIQQVKLMDEWTISFLDGGPELPATMKLEQLDWVNRLGNPSLEAFGGLIRYENRFWLDCNDPGDLVIHLGRLSSSAQVFVNHQLIGTSIREPHELTVPVNMLNTGVNHLVVEIASLADNRIRYMDRASIPWRIFKDINFRSLEYGDFDASGWLVQDYGLKGPVKVQLLK